MHTYVRSTLAIAAACIVVLLAACTGNGGNAGRLAIPLSDEGCLRLDGDVDRLQFEPDGTVVWEAPLGDRVLFSFPLPEGETFDSYGLGKFDLKIEHGPVDVMVFIERPGEKRRVYRPIDITEPRDGWQTIHFELDRPEIIRETHYTAEKPRVTFNMWSVKGGYAEEYPTRRITIKNVRLVQHRLDVNWNGCDYKSTAGSDGALTYEYPVTVVNRDETGRTVSADLEHYDGTLGTGTIEPASARIAAGDSASFTVTLKLAPERLAELPALYCEWFRPYFSIGGIADSEEGIIRSSDHILLPLIIMPKRQINPIVQFDRHGLEEMRERYQTKDWAKKEGDGWIKSADALLKSDLTVPDGPGWAAAYYFCVEHRTPLVYEGPDKHRCPIGGEYLEKDWMGVDLDRDYRTNQHARIFRAAKTLARAYALTEDARYSEAVLDILHQYREKYFTFPWLDLDASTETIDRGRVQFAKYMEAIYMLDLVEAYDILKGLGAVSEQDMADIEWNLLIPASVEMTDYRMGMIHRQQVITKNALTTGLVCGHAPLTAFAMGSHASIFKLRRHMATTEGIAHGHGYANPLHRQFDMSDMLYRVGVDVFDSSLKRFLWGSLWWNVPFNPSRYGDVFNKASKHYPDPELRAYARRNLIDGEPAPLYGTKLEFGNPPSVNFPNSGVTLLRRPWKRGTMDAEFKWGMPDNRGSFSMMSLGLYFGGYRAQSYPGHFPWGSTDLHHNWQIQSASHSTIVVDRRNQSGMKDYFKDHYMPHASRQIFYEEGEYATSTVAYNDRMYPGVEIWRAVSVLDGAYVVLDIMRSEQEHTYDRWFHGVPDNSNGLEGIALDLKPHVEPLGDTDGYQMVERLSSAVTSENLTADWAIKDENVLNGLRLGMRVLNDTMMDVTHGYEWSRQFRTPDKEFLLLTKTARNADFTVLYEPYTGRSSVDSFERIPVKGADGSVVNNAIGVRVTMGQNRYEIILNPDNIPVQTPQGVLSDVYYVYKVQ